MHVDTLEIGGHVLTDITAAVSPQSDGAQANIGVSVLRNFKWVIDFPGTGCGWSLRGERADL